MAWALTKRLRNHAARLNRTCARKSRLDHAIASFTFDDFPASAYEIGGKILDAAKVKGTFFVSGCYLGQTLGNVVYYSEDHLKAAHANGHEIGCHTFHHNALGEMGARFALLSCEENSRFIQGILGREVIMSSFAYPYGDVSTWVKSALASHFPVCRGVHAGSNTDKIDFAQIEVVSLEMRHASRLDLRRVITDALKRNGWIVFLSHDVAADPSPYGSTPLLIEKALEAVTSAGIPILPLKAAAARAFHGN